MYATTPRICCLLIAGVLATITTGATGAMTGKTDRSGWTTHSNPALLMYPLRFPTDWKVESLARPGISLLRATSPQGSAAMEVYTGMHRGDIDAPGLARSAIANLVGGPEPAGTKPFRDSRRTLQGVFSDIAIRGVLIGPRAAVAIAMTGRLGQQTLAHYRVILAPKEDVDGLFDRLVAEHFPGLIGPLLPKPGKSP